MSQTNDPEIIQRNGSEMSELVIRVIEADHEPTPEELQIAGAVIALYLESELPHFEEIPGITSTTNETAYAKYPHLLRIEEIRDRLLSPVYTEMFPIPDLADREGFLEILKVAPWANMIHGWTKVLNLSHSIEGAQRNEEGYSPENIAVILSITTNELYRFTTAYEQRNLLRQAVEHNGKDILPETIMRGWRTVGLNPTRHLDLKEMLYILNTLRESYPKSLRAE